jgi:hypothetical protein
MSHHRASYNQLPLTNGHHSVQVLQLLDTPAIQSGSTNATHAHSPIPASHHHQAAEPPQAQSPPPPQPPPAQAPLLLFDFAPAGSVSTPLPQSSAAPTAVQEHLPSPSEPPPQAPLVPMFAGLQLQSQPTAAPTTSTPATPKQPASSLLLAELVDFGSSAPQAQDQTTPQTQTHESFGFIQGEVYRNLSASAFTTPNR